MRKLRHRKVECLAQVHIAAKNRSQDVNPSFGFQLGLYLWLPIGEDRNQGQEAVFRVSSCRFSQVSQPGPAAGIHTQPQPRNVTALCLSMAGVGGRGGSEVLAAVTNRKQIVFPFASTPSQGRGRGCTGTQ